MRDPRLTKLAEVLVNYSVAVKPEQFVLVQGEDVAIEWIEAVAEAALKAGAHVETIVKLPEVEEHLLKNGTEAQRTHAKIIQKYALEQADVWLTAFASRNTRRNSNVSSELLKQMNQGASSWRKVYSARMGDKSLNWCGAQFPTQADAQEAEMSLREYQEFVYQSGLLNTPDPAAAWREIEAQQECWVKYLDTKQELHFQAAGTDLKVGIMGRKWINCCGKVNFPDGEIFTSPIENQVHGYITFSFPAIYMGKMVEGIRLEVVNGKIVKATAEKGEELLLTLLEMDPGARYFGEVAIGTNYQIQKFTKNILFDEKIGGTIHLAVGDAFGEAGGKNHSAIHWDMICDMRGAGTISADGEVFYRNGKFLDEVLGK